MGDEGLTTMITGRISQGERSKLTARELLITAGSVRSSSSSKNQQSDNSTPPADDEEKLLLKAADLSLGHNGSEPNFNRRLRQLANGDFVVSHSAVVGDIIYTRNSKFSCDLDQSTETVSSTLHPHPEEASIIKESLVTSGEDDNPVTIEARGGGGIGEWVDLGASFVAHARLAMLYHSRCVQRVIANDPSENDDCSHHNGTSSSSGRSNSESDVSSSSEMKVNRDYQLSEEAAAVAMKVYGIVFCSKALGEEDITDENEADVVSEEGGREGELGRSKAAKRSNMSMLYIVLKRQLFNKLSDTEDSNSGGDDSCGYTHSTAHGSDQSGPTGRGHEGSTEGHRLCYSKEYMKEVRRSMHLADLLPKQRGGRGRKKASFTEGFNRIEKIVNNHRVHFENDTDTGTGGGALNLDLTGHKSCDGSDLPVHANVQATASAADGAGGYVSSSSSTCTEKCDGTAGNCGDDDNESCSEEEKEEGIDHDHDHDHEQSALRSDGSPLGCTDESSSISSSSSGSKSIGIGGSVAISIGRGDRGCVNSSGGNRVPGLVPAPLPLKGNKKDRRNALRLEKFGAPKTPLPAL
jgi:hypothetical protein